MSNINIDKFANKQTPEQIEEMTRKIWINAFQTINPTDKFKLELADTILDMIKNTKHKEYGATITYIRIATS